MPQSVGRINDHNFHLEQWDTCSLLLLACQMLSCVVFEPLNRVTWSQTIKHWVTSAKSTDFCFETIRRLSLVLGIHWRHSLTHLITWRRMCFYFSQCDATSARKIYSWKGWMIPWKLEEHAGHLSEQRDEGRDVTTLTTKTKETPLKETCLFLPCVPAWMPKYIYFHWPLGSWSGDLILWIGVTGSCGSPYGCWH